MDDGRSLEVRLPADLPNPRYAALAHAVWAVLNSAGLAETSSLRLDTAVTDTEMNATFDRDSQLYPWGP